MKGVWKVREERKHYKPGSVRPQFNTHNYFMCSNTVLRHITTCRVKGKEIWIEEMISPGVFVPISVDEFRSKYGL